MFQALLLTIAAPAVSLALPVAAATAPALATFLLIDDVDDAIASAGEDAARLSALGETWAAEENEDAARRAWARVLEIDSRNEAAHNGLRHHRHADTWYETYAALARARRDEAKRRFEAEGVVPFGNEWVLAEDLPFRRMQWDKLDDGSWAPAGTKARQADEKAKLAAGWEKQHRAWVDPADFDKWRKGLWMVEGDWLDTAAANEAHAKIGAWWEIPGEHFVALTTVTEEESRWVVWWADAAHADLVRMFGLDAAEKPEFVVLNSVAQYNDFNAGNAAEARGPADASGFSSVHYAYFTDGWTDTSGPVPVFRGTGAAYHDVNDAGLKPFGQHAVRHAAALAWLEAVDPSWNAVSEMLTSPGGVFPDRRYWGEKRIPRWMRYGAAAYCERFFEDKNAADGGDPMWARKWALKNLKTGGSLDSIEDIIAMQFDTADPEASSRLIHEAGLVVHFLIDGKDKRVGKAWGAYRTALIAGDEVTEQIADLEAALVKAQKKVASFGGI